MKAIGSDAVFLLELYRRARLDLEFGVPSTGNQAFHIQAGLQCWHVLCSPLSSAALQFNLGTQRCSGCRDVAPAQVIEA